MKDPVSFEEFWPGYLKEHNGETTRALHVGGTAVGVGLVALSVATRKPRLALLGLLSAYGTAWASHLLVERNVPETFAHPMWSLRADLRMLRLALQGELEAEVAKVRSSQIAAE